MGASNVRARPRLGVLGYGSILDPGNLDDVVEDGERTAIPVKVFGFKRTFNQEASWREVNGRERGVLNVERADGGWFNAILLPDLDREEFRMYRERERGYTLIEVESDAVEPYDDTDERRIDELDLLLVPTGKKRRDDIDPIPEYVRICARGAAHWRSQRAEFYRDFLDTTETAGGERIERYLGERPRSDGGQSG